MLNFDIVLSLNKAKEETNLFGVMVYLGKEYGYGYGFIQKISGECEYEVTTLSRSLEKSEMLNNSEFKNKVEELIMEDSYNEEWFKSIEVSIEAILNEFKDSNKTVGEYTELKNIEDIVSYLDREKLDFLIFKEDEIW